MVDALRALQQQVRALQYQSAALETQLRSPSPIAHGLQELQSRRCWTVHTHRREDACRSERLGIGTSVLRQGGRLLREGQES